MGDYTLKCMHPNCKKVYDTDNFRLICDSELSGEHGPALLRTTYEKKHIDLEERLPGIFKFLDWLPCGDKYLAIEGKPITYKSEGLAKYLGLSNLWIAYSGFWPAKGADIVTRTFKQLEAPATIARYLSCFEQQKPLIVSSAGNTANAFNYVTHMIGLPLYLVVPKSGLRSLRLPIKTSPFSIVVDGDYSDAIELADKISEKTGLFREGGVKNVARRDGMGVAMLEAVTEKGSLFEHYFQAVGSASGGIAAWEAVLRLIEDGRFGDTKTKLHLAQNSPFTPIVDSWEKKSQTLIELLEKDAREQIKNVVASVLTNRHPPYSIAGGIFDALSDTNGETYGINNQESFDASRIFRATEGIDIGPAASIATAALIKAIEERKVKSDESILLHITGGGFEAELQRFGKNLFEFEPTITIKPEEIENALNKIGKIAEYNMTNLLLKTK